MGLADTAVREALAAPATQQAGATKEHVRLVRVIANKIEDGSLFRSGIYSNKDLARFVRNVADAAAPQFPTAQAAESVPAIQGETNVQLDTDSNPTAPGKQRDMACSLALGQPVGNGQDQAAGHLGAQGDKLLTVAERNIRSFLRSATFKSESDREAALNCVDVLGEAVRASAESVPAVGYPPLPDFDSGDEPIWEAIFNWKAATPGSDAHRKANAIESAIINQLRAYVDAYVDADRASRDPADSVLEDASRYEMVRRGQHWSVVDGIGNCLRAEGLDAAVDTVRKQRGAT